MDRIAAWFYIFENSNNKVIDKNTGLVWSGRHMSPVTSNSVVTYEELRQLPDSEFEVFKKQE